MATIKDIIQGFCYRINVPAPTSFVTATGPSEAQYLSLFRFIGDMLRNKPFAWPQLKRGYTFTTSTGVSIYELPGDFYRILDSSQWDTTNQWPLRGPISDYAFTARQYSVVSLQTRKAFRIIGPTQYLYSTSPWSKRSSGTFQIDPAADNSSDVLFLGYTSCNWIWPRDWVTSTVYAAGAIVAGNGYVYRTAAGGTSGATRPSHSTGSESDGTVTWTVYTEPYQVTSANTNLNDNDLCLFDDDLMIEGMRWAYLRAKGMDYQTERNDWEMQVKSAFSRFDGPIRVNMSDEFDEDSEWPLTPIGSWDV
jgi:hypothetical protein